VTDTAKDLLGKESYDRMYSARPQRRVITCRIEDQLSEELLRCRISRRDTVLIDGSPGGGFTFHAEPRREETASEDPGPPNGAPA
jgi:ATP-dependent Clp protease ATP-binding subunit ClpA